MKSSAIYTPNAYIRGYLQGSENGRVHVVTIGVNIAKRNITTGLFGLMSPLILV